MIEDLGVHQLVPGKAIENEAWLASWPEVPSIDVIRASESRREVLRPGQITDPNRVAPSWQRAWFRRVAAWLGISKVVPAFFQLIIWPLKSRGQLLQS